MTKEIRPEVVIDELLTRQIASAMLDNQSATFAQIAKTLNIPTMLVRKVCLSAKFKDIITKAGQDELGPALARAKVKMARLADKAMTVIEQQLDDGNLNAALAVLKGIGMDEQVDKQVDQTLTIILPGAERQQKTIDISTEE